jgi:(4-O-methyl)-D-glucuronate---lignin esterase
VFDAGTAALNGKAIRRQVRIYLNMDKNGPSIQLLIYLPAATKKPAPMLLSINFGAVQDAVEDPGIKPETVWDAKTDMRVMPKEGQHFGRLDVEPFLARASEWPRSIMATWILIVRKGSRTGFVRIT